MSPDQNFLSGLYIKVMVKMYCHFILAQQGLMVFWNNYKGFYLVARKERMSWT